MVETFPSPTSSTNLHRTLTSSLDVWECAEGEFEWQVATSQSTCVLTGRAEVDLADGRRLSLEPGKAVYLPGGVHGRWVVEKPLRMVAVSFAG